MQTLATTVNIVGSAAHGGMIANARIDFGGMDLYKAHVRTELKKRLMEICERVKTQVQRNISIPTRSLGPSLEGEFPHADTGRLRNSIFWSIDEADLSAIVGTPLTYGVILEYGTEQQEFVILPQNAMALHWIDPETGDDVFAAKVVKRQPMLPRPFLRRTLTEMAPKIQQILNRPIADLPNKTARIG